MKARKDKKTTQSKRSRQSAQVPAPRPVIEMTDKDLEQVIGGSRVDENLGRSQSDAEKSITQN